MAGKSPLGRVRKLSYDRRAMWVVRELLRLLWSIVVAGAIASVIAIGIALLHGGDFTRELRLTFLFLGCLLLLLAGAGNRSTGASRRATGSLRQFAPGWLPGATMTPDATPVGPTLTQSAVFVGSAFALIALGLAI
jgi:hypothetical protein